MLRPRVKIDFNKADEKFSVTYLKGFEAYDTYEKLTGVCTIIFPAKYQQLLGDTLFSQVSSIFRRGDQVNIYSGYYPNQRLVFSGYIRNVNANIPTILELEDSMFLLKKYTFNIPAKIPLITKSKKGKFLKRPKVDTTKLPNLTLEELFNIIIPDDIEFKILDNITISKIRFSNATPCMILEKLKESHGLFSYFVGSVLYIGFASDAQDTVEQELKFEEQVINANELFYHLAEDISIKIRATSIDKNNIPTTVIVGPDDGEQRDYHYYNISKDALTKLANERLVEDRYTGYYGTLETFLEPPFRHGDRVSLKSTALPERNGTYLIKSVKRLVDVDRGGRQFLELGRKVS